MNTKNNKRRRESIRRIEKAFIECVQTRNVESISVSEICKIASVNRSTFYANYADINDLSHKVIIKLWEDFLSLYEHDINDRKKRLDFIKLFTHIYENQFLYKTYFKLSDFNIDIVGYDEEIAALFFDMKYIDYHIEFFKNGFNAIIKKWLNGGCKETPEEMQQILNNEYRKDLSLLDF